MKRHQQKAQTNVPRQSQSLGISASFQGQKLSSNTEQVATVEELLRADAAATEVPDAIAARLNQSLRNEETQPMSRPWWRRWFGK